MSERVTCRDSGPGSNTRPRAGRRREASQSSSGPYETASEPERHRIVAATRNCSDAVPYDSRSGSYAGIMMLNRIFETGSLGANGDEAEMT